MPTRTKTGKFLNWYLFAFDIKGSWYTNLNDGKGINKPYDSQSNYCEVYVKDSTIKYQEESEGMGFTQKYFIRKDSIYKCFFPESCDYIAMYKILRFNFDTVWLAIHPAYAKNQSHTFWIRLPEEEKGLYDHVWTDSLRDSLELQVNRDFDRRRWKFYAIKGNDMTGYDSALKAGYWNFTMRQIEEESKKYMFK